MEKVKIMQREGIVLHHTCTGETCSVADIESMHRKKGMACVGYHRLIKRDTKSNKAYTKEGRNLIYQGAHTYIESLSRAKSDPLAKGDRQYYNKRWIGVALIGDYEHNDINPEYYRNVVKELAYMMKKFNVKRLRGHRECDATLCPGKNINMNKLRKDVSAVLGYEIGD